MEYLLEPFTYGFMINAMWVSALVGGVCAFLSCYLMLKGWSLIGDALSHSVVPGVAGAYILGLPFALGAFIAGGLAAGARLFLSERSGLKGDVIIGLFFDENHARTIGLRPSLLKAIFFILLSACVVAAMQTVGAFLVIALVVTPGATAYLLCDRFPRLIIVSVAIGSITSFLGAYISYFLNGATGGIIVTLQTLIFLVAFVFAPKHGLLAAKRKAKQALEQGSGDLAAEFK